MASAGPWCDRRWNGKRPRLQPKNRARGQGPGRPSTLQVRQLEWFGPAGCDHLVQLSSILHKRRERIHTLISERLELLALNTMRKPNRCRDFQLAAEDFPTVKFEAPLALNGPPAAWNGRYKLHLPSVSAVDSALCPSRFTVTFSAGMSPESSELINVAGLAKALAVHLQNALPVTKRV